MFTREIKSILPDFSLSSATIGLLAILAASWANAHDDLSARPHHLDVPANPTAVMRAFTASKADSTGEAQSLVALSAMVCDNGSAGAYPCNKVDLFAFMPRADFGGGRSNDEINDLWGWTDPTNGREYALVGRVFGTSFIDVTNPTAPVYIGELPLHGTFGSSWRDIKVYKNHAFIVSEASQDGMQIFDLTQLRTATPGTTFGETAHYGGFGNAHNLVINEETGFAYAVGANTCSGGLTMVDINDPLNPVNAGCFSSDGYSHDAQCVIYRGTDLNNQGEEICFASNEDTLTIVNVSDKANPFVIGSSSYNGSRYTHQGWLSEDHNTFYLDDELDEYYSIRSTTTTRIWDLGSQLDAVNSVTGPLEVSFGNTSIDHNQYVKGRYVYQANYRSGLRIVDTTNVSNVSTATDLAGYFDTYPADDAAEFNSAWSNYPYFASGTVIVSDIESGLFILHPTVDLVEFAGPWHGSILSGPNAAINIQATDPGGIITNALVSWEADGIPIGPAVAPDSSGAVVLSWDSTSVSDGLHRLTARMVDAGGNATSSTILVTVQNSPPDNRPPEVDITSPTGGKVSGIVSIEGSASDFEDVIITVKLYLNNVWLHTIADVNGNWSYEWDTNGLKGSQEILAEVVDSESAAASDSVSVRISGGGGSGGGGGSCNPKKPGCTP